MTSVAACHPELPPLEMMSGTKRARTTARSISRSKNPMAVAVSISPRNRTTSHPGSPSGGFRLLVAWRTIRGKRYGVVNRT
jgi:hypothetical protein